MSKDFNKLTCDVKNIDSMKYRHNIKSSYEIMKFGKVLILLNILLMLVPVYSQSNKESGYQLINNYSPKEYEANQQVWSIIQGDSGVMYFGNQKGLLEYDGSEWRIYPVPNNSVVRSLAVGGNNKIYAGAQGDLGYFQPDSIGRLIFHSLMKFVPKNKRDFSDVWNTFVCSNKVYFNAAKYILIWNTEKKEFKIIESKSAFHVMFKVNGTIYVREFGRGLEVIKDDSLNLLKGGEKFADERIYVMLPFPGEDATFLIVTRTMGLLKYDGNKFTPFKTEADNFLKENLIYYPGTILSDGNILLGTINGGAVVIDTTGMEVRIYNTESGLPNNTIYYTLQDRSGAIWLATGNGISRIDYASPISYFDSRNNFSVLPNDIIRYKGIIYTATNNGVYYLDPETNNFQLVKNSINQSFNFLETGNELLVGTFNGLFKVNKDKLSAIRKTIGNEYIVHALRQSQINKNRIYVGAIGVWSEFKSGNNWIDEGQILDITDVVNSIVEDKDGKLWVGTNASGVFRITFRKDEKGNIILTKPVIEHFDHTNRLQNGQIWVDKFNNQNYFSSADSIYKFDEHKKIFYSDTSDNIISGCYRILNHKSLNVFQQDYLGRIWIGTDNSIAMGNPQPDGTYKWLTSPFNRLSDEQINKVYVEQNGIVWFLASTSLIKYDFLKKNPNKTDYSALIRKVWIGKDSSIYFGEKTAYQNSPVITYKNNSIKFRFSATSYEGKNLNRFKTFLKGFDNSWSPWSNENTKEYTNLSPGKYTFNVAAENILGIESSKGSYSFEILPPWYRTWWAYIIYGLLLGGLIFLVDRVQRKRVVSKERERAELREAKLRADSENERRKNVELLSEIGKDITGSLTIENIISTSYEHVNALMDASVFGIGIFNKDHHRLDFPATKEKGKTLPVYSYDLNDKNRPASWCFNYKKEIFINDFEKEYRIYIDSIPQTAAGESTESLIYLPLIYKDKSIGVLTAQSFSKNAYKDYHLNILRGLATYTALALDNAEAYRILKTTQENLVTQEKLASLGALTAGIAHEIKNPLNFVNNFSEISIELLDEMKVDLQNGNKEEVNEIIEDLKQNLGRINQHGKRADSIVKGMLLHSRGSSGEKILTDVNALLDQYVTLAFHGMRAQDKEFNITIEKDYDQSIGKINIVPQDISRVFLNLINNACYAANEKKKHNGKKFFPILKVSTKNLNDKVKIRIKDNGNGIPDDIIDKVFQPFFTTKPTGEGTGLGLSLSYDIVTKVHGGEIKFESEQGKYTEFIITIPK